MPAAQPLHRNPTSDLLLAYIQGSRRALSRTCSSAAATCRGMTSVSGDTAGTRCGAQHAHDVSPDPCDERKRLITTCDALQVMHVWQMDAMGFQFVAHPNAWVVHRPHAPSAGAFPLATVSCSTDKSCLRNDNRI